jgi:uncharacterized protein
MRIDAHVHYMPPESARHLAEQAEHEPYWDLLLRGDPDRPSLQGWATHERMIQDMQDAGLDRVVVMGDYCQRHEDCVEQNDQTLALAHDYGEQVTGFAVVQPKAGPATLDELERCLDGGLRGVGELAPYAQGFRLEDPDFLRVVEWCIRHGWPLNLHVNEEVGHFYLGKGTTPLRHYYELACRYPELKLILAHWGGGLLFYEIMPEVRRNLRNVWYDTAASPLLFPSASIFRTALACVDPHKLLYASDYPLLICRKKQSEPDFRPFIAEIDALGLEPSVYDNLLGGNAGRLLGLQPEAGGEQPAAPLAQRSGLPLSTDRPIGRLMSVSAVAHAWPATQRVFERYGIPWEDNPVPAWEPIAQAAAAHGLGPAAQARLIEELNEEASVS